MEGGFEVKNLSVTAESQRSQNFELCHYYHLHEKFTSNYIHLLIITNKIHIVSNENTDQRQAITANSYLRVIDFFKE